MNVQAGVFSWKWLVIIIVQLYPTDYERLDLFSTLKAVCLHCIVAPPLTRHKWLHVVWLVQTSVADWFLLVTCPSLICVGLHVYLFCSWKWVISFCSQKKTLLVDRKVLYAFSMEVKQLSVHDFAPWLFSGNRPPLYQTLMFFSKGSVLNDIMLLLHLYISQ